MWCVLKLVAWVMTIVMVRLLAHQVMKMARLMYAFRGIPRLRERFPGSFSLDLFLDMRRLRRGFRDQHGTTRSPKPTIYARWLYEEMASNVPGYYEHPVVGSVLGSVGLIIACTPESTEALLSSKLNVNKDFSHHFLKPWLGNGLLSNPGDASWRSHRKMLTPTMHFRILEDYCRAMNRNALQFVDKMHKLKNEETNIYPLIRMCTFGIIFETALGIKVDENDPEHMSFLSDCDELADQILARIVYLPHWSDFVFKYTSAGRRTKAAADRVTAYIHKIIDAKLDSFEKNYECGKSLIDTLVGMFREKRLSRQDVRDHVATFIVGGFDTTATATAYTLHLLARHPEIQEELFEEVDRVARDDEHISKEQLHDLRLTEAICKESMRLFPPLPLITRNVTTPFRIGNHEIPSGTVGVVDIFHLHRNPNVWEEPLEFKPSRFLDPVKRHPYAFVPFSAGPRNCLGQRFANQELKILMVHIIRNFKLHTTQKSEDLHLIFDLILRPLGGVSVRCEPRTQ